MLKLMGNLEEQLSWPNRFIVDANRTASFCWDLQVKRQRLSTEGYSCRNSKTERRVQEEEESRVRRERAENK